MAGIVYRLAFGGQGAVGMFRPAVDADHRRHGPEVENEVARNA
ncbi:MAG: hypothetical protein NUW22_11185 [Acidobacteria bacterium]|nr:hypothetical protein [Acidobacteriota bacterium]